MGVTLPEPSTYGKDWKPWATRLCAVIGIELNKPLQRDLHYFGTSREPGFGTNWSNFGGTTAGAFFFKASEMVVLGGVVQNAGGGAPAAGSTIFTLPLGYRPEGDLRLLCGGSPGTYTIYVSAATGAVTYQAGTLNGASPWVTWLGLAGTFPAARRL